MPLYKAEGVVLRTRNLGEADRIVTLYTRERGKVDGVARGSRRTRSRLIGGTQLFTQGRYLLYSGRSLDTISQAEIKQSFAGLREDLFKMAYASYVAELLDLMVEPDQPGEDLFDLTVAAFGLLQDGPPAEVVVRWYEFNLMARLGYEPELQACVSCFRAVPGDARFSVREGGVLCGACASRDGSAVAVRRSTVEFIKRFLATSGDRLGIVRPSVQELALLEAVARPYVDFRLPWPLRSLGFLSSVKDLA